MVELLSFTNERSPEHPLLSAVPFRREVVWGRARPPRVEWEEHFWGIGDLRVAMTGAFPFSVPSLPHM